MSWLAAWVRTAEPAGGRVDLRLGLHASPGGPVLLWSEDHEGVLVGEGGWTPVLLGSQEPLQASLFDDRPRWLSVRALEAGGPTPELAPRQPLDGRPLTLAGRLEALAARQTAPSEGLSAVRDAVQGLRDHLDTVVLRVEQLSVAGSTHSARLAAAETRIDAAHARLEQGADALADVVGAGGELHDHERRIHRLEAQLAGGPAPVATDSSVHKPREQRRRAAPDLSPSPAVEVRMSAELPPSPWFDRVREAYLDGSASVFVLYGLVHDLHPAEGQDGLQWGPLGDAVSARLAPSRDLLLRLDPFHGLRADNARARRHLEGRPLEPGLRPALARIGRLLGDRRQSTAVVIDHADLLFPAVRPELPDDRLCRSALRHWLDDPGLRESNNILFLLAPRRLQLAAELLEHPRVLPVEVEPHTGPTVRAYLRSALGTDVPLADALQLDGLLLSRVGALSRLARSSAPATPDAWVDALGPLRDGWPTTDQVGTAPPDAG